MNKKLASGLLFLPLQQGIQTDTIDSENSVARSGKVTICLTLGTTNALYLYLVMLVYEVQRSIAWKKCGYGFPVFYDLRPNALADGTVGLAAFHPNLLQDDGFSLWRSLERIGFVVQSKHSSLVWCIGPPELFPPLPKFLGREQPPRRLSHSSTVLIDSRLAGLLFRLTPNRSERNRPKSTLISNLTHDPILALKSFGDRSGFPVFFPFHQSPDPALNRKTRRLSTPDRKFSREKGGGYCTEHLATQEWLSGKSIRDCRCPKIVWNPWFTGRLRGRCRSISSQADVSCQSSGRSFR